MIERKDGSILILEVKSGNGYKTHAALSNALEAKAYNISEAFVLAEPNIDIDDEVVYLSIYIYIYIYMVALIDI